MKNKKEKKSILIGVLLCAVVLMGIGYAALASQLDINGTASISSKWDVRFISMTDGTPVGGATNVEKAGFSSTTVTFNVGLVSPGDSMTYVATIKNNGTLDAKLDSIDTLPISNENHAITYTVTGITEGSVLAAGEEVEVTIVVAYDSTVEEQPEETTRTLSVIFNYVQNV